MVDLKYREEVDGLRALAVISIVIYHFFPGLMPKGYLGVDIFFVISGYLITGKLIFLKNSNFQRPILTFYLRRIKRIFPALFVFFLITTFLIINILLKSDIDKYSSSLFSSKTIWSNIYFWRDGGYFGGNDQLKPLLHTWSLSVEEQFYLLYPSFILICYWIKKKLNLPIIIFIFAIIILSFLLWFYLNLIGVENTAFFLLPARAWQFGLGALIFFLMLKKNILHNSLKNIILIISIIFITCGLFLSINNQIQTVMVSFGSLLFIYSSLENKVLPVNFFRNSIVVWIGKISYSIYLYHWPVAAVLIYYYIDSPPFYVSIIGIILTIIISNGSYKYIEIPFRHKFNFKHTIILIITCTLISFSTLKFTQSNKTEYLEDKWSKVNGSNYRCPVLSYFTFGASRACIIEDGSQKNSNNIIAIMGNSHAQMYAPLFADMIKKKGYKGFLIPLNSCLPTVTLNINNFCLKQAKKNLNSVLNNKNIKHVFIAMTWYENKYVSEIGNEVNYNKLIDAIKDLKKKLNNEGKTVSVLSPISTPKYDIASELPRMLKFGMIKKSDIHKKISIDRESYNLKFNEINSKLKKYLGIHYVEVYKDLCDDDLCYFAKKDLMYFSDSTHLSKFSLDNLKITQLQIKKILNNLSIK